MNFLLDTHAWIWAVETPARLGRKATAWLENPREGDARAVSPMSMIELSQLLGVGRLTLAVTAEDWIRRSFADLQLETVELSSRVALEAWRLPGEFHRDPADRILVATARVFGLTLLTADERILAYPHVQTVDARK